MLRYDHRNRDRNREHIAESKKSRARFLGWLTIFNDFQQCVVWWQSRCQPCVPVGNKKRENAS